MAGRTTPCRRAFAAGGGSASEFAIAHLEVGRLAQGLASPAEPVGEPVHHLPGPNPRVAGQAGTGPALSEPGGRPLRAPESRRPTVTTTAAPRAAAPARSPPPLRIAT